jgi:hypothetical protein
LFSPFGVALCPLLFAWWETAWIQVEYGWSSAACVGACEEKRVLSRNSLFLNFNLSESPNEPFFELSFFVVFLSSSLQRSHCCRLLLGFLVFPSKETTF